MTGRAPAAERGSQKSPFSVRGGSPLEVFAVALRLGLTSFGGPIAHIGYFRREYVERRGWLDEASFADLIALCQFLPGPASSELGIAIGTRRAGRLGGLAAWLGFTIPSAVALVLFGLFARSADLVSAGWVHGLKLAAVAVVALAVYSMTRTLTPDWPRRLLAVAAAAVALLWSTPLTQLAIIVGGAAAGRLLLRPPGEGADARRGRGADPPPDDGADAPPDDGAEALRDAALPRPAPAPDMVGGGVSRRFGSAALAAFLILLVALPIVRLLTNQHAVALVDAFYRSGALVFGGGHVVLPLLHATVVDPGWVSNDSFLAGYGAAQAVPGPLFTFASYLGTIEGPAPNGPLGGVIALVAIFTPALLLIFGTLPFWDGLRGRPAFRRMLGGTNAAVVGILAAALYNPIWVSAIAAPADVMVAAAGLALLATGRVPPIAIVALCAVAGQLGG